MVVRCSGARVLAEVGDDNRRFGTAGGLRAFAGTAPVTRASGRSKYVKARKVRNKRLGDACHWGAFAMLTKSAGARGHYDRRRAAGDHHNAALRNLADKLLIKPRRVGQVGAGNPRNRSNERHAPQSGQYSQESPRAAGTSLAQQPN